MNQMVTMNEVFPNWMEGKGIFDALNSLNVPWSSENIDLELDMLYFGNHSGQKYISPLIRNIKEGDTLTDSERHKLAEIIFTLYKASWEHEFELLQIEYNPIEDYNTEEEMSDDNTKFIHGKISTRTPNLTDTTTPNITETNTPNTTRTTNDSTYGFNSTESVSKDSSTSSDTGTDTTVTTGTNSVTKTGTESIADTGTDETQHGYKKTIKGFTGKNTPIQMIEQSIEFWEWSFYRDVVFRDIDRVLTLPIY